jgi:hypothetical protein
MDRSQCFFYKSSDNFAAQPTRLNPSPPPWLNVGPSRLLAPQSPQSTFPLRVHSPTMSKTRGNATKKRKEHTPDEEYWMSEFDSIHAMQVHCASPTVPSFPPAFDLTAHNHTTPKLNPRPPSSVPRVRLRSCEVREIQRWLLVADEVV